jgi:hypothetical protein
MLEPVAHHDLPDLPDDRAAEMGLLIVRIAQAIESLPHIARAHVSRWGDGETGSIADRIGRWPGFGGGRTRATA